MTESLSSDQIFINKLTDLVLANLEDDNFGVKELAHKSGMSLYRLGRKLSSINKKTSNQFIREIRLEKAFEMLQNEVYTVAEVAYKTGFGSSNYFNKCFHEYYGYPPGKVKKGESDNKLNNHSNGINSNVTEKSKWRKYIFNLPGILLMIILSCIIVFLLYNKIHNSEWSEDLISRDGKISLVVMPFRNLTNDTIWDIWQEGIQNSLISFLANSEELNVKLSVNEYIQSKGFTDYASLAPSVDNIIAKKLDARIFISGGIINNGANIIVTAQIFDTDKKEAIKSFEIKGPAKGEMIFQLIDSLRHQVDGFFTVAKLKKKDPGSAYYFFDPISSPEAYRYMVAAIKAERNSNFTSAIDLYKQAINIDSSIYDAFWRIAIAFGEQGDLENCKSWLLRYYKKYDKLNMYNKAYANYLYAIIFKTPYDAIRYVEQMMDLSDRVPYNYVNLGDEYNRLFEYDKAIPEYEKAIEIYNKWGTKPPSPIIYTELG
jgi:AraC-like DNA-binding protein/TolB-like protein